MRNTYKYLTKNLVCWSKNSENTAILIHDGGESKFVLLWNKSTTDI